MSNNGCWELAKSQAFDQQINPWIIQLGRGKRERGEPWRHTGQCESQCETAA
jgi:hypothetical protein